MLAERQSYINEVGNPRAVENQKNISEQYTVLKNKIKTYLFRERLGGMVYIGMSECAEKQKRKEIQII